MCEIQFSQYLHKIYNFMEKISIYSGNNTPSDNISYK